MADLKSMFATMANNSAAGGDNVQQQPQPETTTKQKKAAIEKTYQKKSQLEHILLRPDTYIGSIEKTSESMWVYDFEKDMILQKEIQFVPGLYKIFDEILVNAADNKQRDQKMDCIKIEINAESNTISVWNNGEGIPVAMHKDENMYVPTMIFGHLLTSSNYNDEEEKVTGGRNGYGAKLCNIFSTKFTVETASSEYKREYKQTWGNNMSKTTEPKIKAFGGQDYTKITFTPDLEKFKMDRLDDDIVGLMSRRAYDIAASTRGVKVILNGKRIPVKSFKDYIDLYIKGKEDATGNQLKVIHDVVNERWEVGITISDKGFQQMSFVNSIATTKGGRHTDYVADMMVKQLMEVIKKKNKGGTVIKPHQVKTHMWVFVNCLIVNPSFDSQTKEHMTLQVKNFGSKCNLSEKFISQIVKSGIIESVLSWAKFKAQNELVKASGKKQSKLKGIPKLEDANESGTKNGLRCTLILTEGDSAKSLAVAGLGVLGRDYYGVFPLRGKLLNVREATHKQILENQEINNLIKILGLQYKKKYNSVDDMKTLRYGKIMIMADQDQDGSHIKGLVINFIHYNWPELLRQNFIEEFITPIVKARKRNETLSFYSLPEFAEWQANTANYKTYQIKYYKGLGTSTSIEAKEYFSNMDRHRIRFRYQGQQDDDHIVLAFSKKHVEHRKEWLTNFMVESKRRKEIGLPDKYLYTPNTKYVTFTDFVNLELVLFSNADNVRSIPSLVDGLKPGQRKVMFTCFKRNDKREVKVAQLASYVGGMTAYHHGEVSLCMTIVNLAQNFVGSNNINLLEPRGQFGTRISGGRDCASPRYIFTKMSPLTRMIFHPNDDPLLKHEYDDNQKIEPVWYIPIIPMLLVNGADGIGTGWMTKIPNYNPRQIVENLRAMLDNSDPSNMIPWYKNFNGTVEDCGERRFAISGEIAITGNNKLEITELPIGTWTQNYKENVLEPLLHGSEKVKSLIQDYKEYNTDTTVKFILTVQPGQLETLQKGGIHKMFKLQSLLATSSMCAFDELGCIRRFDSVLDILQEFYTLRLKMYQNRKDYLEGVLEAEAAKLSNQARFIMEKCDGTLVVENKKRKIIVEELYKRGYVPDPVKEWKERSKVEDDEDDANSEEEEETASTSSKKSEKAFKNATDVQKFDYLLGMSMWMLTEEKKNELLRQRDSKLAELDVVRKKTKEDLWREDLDAFMGKLDEVEQKERDEEAGVKNIKKAPAGRKRVNLQETMPSPVAQRVAPTISDDLRKRIQSAVKTKENKGKRTTKKENIADEDEFDTMVKSKKTLIDKIGSPDDAEKRGKAKKQKDGLKQTKLNFKKKSPDGKANGSPKKRGKKTSDSEDIDSEDIESSMSMSGSDVEFTHSRVVATERVMSKRAASKKITYNISDESENVSEEGELFDKDAVKEQQQVVALSSDSDNETAPPPNVSSEDLFDSLLGRKKDDEAVPTKVQKRKQPIDESGSDADIFSSDKKETKTETKKKKVDYGSSSASNSDFGVNKKKTTKTKTKKKKADDDSDGGSDSDFGVNKKKTTKTKTKKKKAADDSDGGSDSDFGVKKTTKTKTKKKKADDDSDGGSDSDFGVNVKKAKKNKTKKKNADDDSDVGSDSDLGVNAKKAKKTKTKQKKNVGSSDDKKKKKKPNNSDSDFSVDNEEMKAEKNKKKTDDSEEDVLEKLNILNDSSDEEMLPPPSKSARSARNVKQTKYVFDSDSD